MLLMSPELEQRLIDVNLLRDLRSYANELRDWPVLVCGLGRCGSSLTMQMLHAGGFPALGEGPAFEPQEVGLLRNMAALLPTLSGKAAKILDPRLSKWPEGFNARVIWLDRDSREQAKSQVKMMATFGNIRIAGQTWRKVQKQIAMDRELTLPLFSDVPMIRLRFESILADPAKTADTIRLFLQAPELDRQAMIETVISRSPQCAPGFEIEQSLVEKALASK